MTPRHPTPVLDGSYRRRKGVLFVPAAEGLPARLSGHAPPAAVHGLPLPSERARAPRRRAARGGADGVRRGHRVADRARRRGPHRRAGAAHRRGLPQSGHGPVAPAARARREPAAALRRGAAPPERRAAAESRRTTPGEAAAVPGRAAAPAGWQPPDAAAAPRARSRRARVRGPGRGQIPRRGAAPPPRADGAAARAAATPVRHGGRRPRRTRPAVWALVLGIVGLVLLLLSLGTLFLLTLPCSAGRGCSAAARAADRARRERSRGRPGAARRCGSGRIGVRRRASSRWSRSSC